MFGPGWAWTVHDGPLSQQTAVFLPGWSARELLDLWTGTVHDADVDLAGHIVVTVASVNPAALYVKRYNGSGWDSLFDGLTFSAMPGSGPIGNLALDAAGKPWLAVWDRTNDVGTIRVLTLQNY